MKIVESSYEILNFDDNALEKIERSARLCYLSEPKGSPENFVRKLIERGHHTPLEMASITVKFVCDRGVSHELVRHRLASFNQESTRYCRYNDEITVIKPLFIQDEFYADWYIAVSYAERGYIAMLKAGATPEQARSVLPMSLKTEIICTANLREWRHIFNLRCSEKSHSDMVAIMRPLLKECYERLPVVFDDIYQRYFINETN
jgi:thymidylate synthase (FAD)